MSVYWINWRAFSKSPFESSKSSCEHIPFHNAEWNVCPFCINRLTSWFIEWHDVKWKVCILRVRPREPSGRRTRAAAGRPNSRERAKWAPLRRTRCSRVLSQRLLRATLRWQPACAQWLRVSSAFTFHTHCGTERYEPLNSESAYSITILRCSWCDSWLAYYCTRMCVLPSMSFCPQCHWTHQKHYSFLLVTSLRHEMYSNFYQKFFNATGTHRVAIIIKQEGSSALWVVDKTLHVLAFYYKKALEILKGKYA